MYISFFAAICSGCTTHQAKNQPAEEKKRVFSRAEMVDQVLQKWNEFHNSAEKLDSLASLYADSVTFYGQWALPAAICVEKTKQIFAQNPSFKQSIDSIHWDNYANREDSSRIICYFLKEVKIGTKLEKYDSYLNFIWNFSKNRYEIDNEGDATTDTNLEIRAIAATQVFEKGDFNGDSTQEKMWLQLEKPNGTLESWSTIHFSDKNIPILPVMSCIGGIPHNEGDLDGDGADEISLIPWWYSSRFTGFRVFSLKNGRWFSLIPSIYCTRDENDDPDFYEKMVEKGDSSFVWIREWNTNNEVTREFYVRKKRKIWLKPIEIYDLKGKQPYVN